MTTKQIVAKWVGMIVFISLLPPKWYVASMACLLVYMWYRMFVVFTFVVPMPSFLTLWRLWKTIYWRRKVIEDEKRIIWERSVAETVDEPF